MVFNVTLSGVRAVIRRKCNNENFAQKKKVQVLFLVFLLHYVKFIVLGHSALECFCSPLPHKLCEGILIVHHKKIKCFHKSNNVLFVCRLHTIPVLHML